MKKFITNLAFIVLSCSSLFSQTDFRKGYVVKLNGDTLHGYINFQKEAENYSICNFKRFEIAFPVSYSPDQLKAYGIDGGKQYLSVRFNEKKVFVEYLVKGEISLLYMNRGGEHFFLLNKKENIVELRHNKMADPNTNQIYSNYRDFLKANVKNGAFTAAIENSKMELNSLIGLVKTFNEQLQYHYEIPERPKGKSAIKDYSILGTHKVQFGIMGGISLYKFSPTITKNVFFYMSNAKYSWEASPLVGVFLKWNVSRTIPRLSLQTNLMYQEVNLYGFSEHPKPANKDIMFYDDLFFSYKEMKLQLLANYNIITKSRFAGGLHAGVGYCNRFDTSYKRYFDEYNTIKNIVKSYRYEDVEISSAEPVLIGGITLEYKLSSARNLLMNIEYEYGGKLIEVGDDAYLQDLNLKGKGSGINITLGITL